jgi:hypothetical protein
MHLNATLVTIRPTVVYTLLTPTFAYLRNINSNLINSRETLHVDSFLWAFGSDDALN